MLSTRQNSRLIKRQRLGLLSLAATLVLAALVAIPLLAQAKDPIAYTIVFGHTDGTTTTVSGVTTENDTFIAEAGGNDMDNPTGMIMHLSCSDEFPDGWGEKQGPDPIADSEWRVVSYFLDKGDKTCGTPPPPPEPSIDLEKATNGEDADNPTGPEISVGGDVEWTFVITNTGDIDLYDITLTDKETLPAAGSAASIDCPRDTLAPGESMTCTATGTAIEGQYANLAKVTGTGLVSGIGLVPPPGVTAQGKYAVVTFVDPATGDRTTLTIAIDKNDTLVPNAGGTSQDDPTGMVMHLSCSDKYLDGWGEKQGPDPIADSAWKVEDFWIFEIKKDEVKTKCGDPVPIEKMVMDTDPSHYIGVPGDPAVDIEKHTNGEDADLPPGPTLQPGDTVIWEYIVTNTGSVDLIDLDVTDDKEGFIGTIPFLAAGDSKTLIHTGIARPGQYVNEGCVVGTSLAGVVVEDCDPSHYDPPGYDEPAIDIEKATNGFDADDPTGPSIPSGDTVEWTYVVTNTGAEPLWGIFVYDEEEGSITCPERFLDIGDSMTCTHYGTAIEGQYANEAWVTGWGYNRFVTDVDWSHYYGGSGGYDEPGIDLEKATNGEDADFPQGPRVETGSTVTWTYVVTNTGAEPLWGIYLFDEEEGHISCPARYLAVGDSMTCTATGTAGSGQYANEAWVTGWGYTGEASDTDWSHYYGYAGSYGYDS